MTKKRRKKILNNGRGDSWEFDPDARINLDPRKVLASRLHSSLGSPRARGKPNSLY